MRSTIPENEKATAPVPAVGAAGEQSIINKTTDSIAENSRERNLRKGSLDTISMTDLFDTAYPPKSVIIRYSICVNSFATTDAIFSAERSDHTASSLEMLPEMKTFFFRTRFSIAVKIVGISAYESRRTV